MAKDEYDFLADAYINLSKEKRLNSLSSVEKFEAIHAEAAKEKWRYENRTTGQKVVDAGRAAKGGFEVVAAIAIVLMIIIGVAASFLS